MLVSMDKILNKAAEGKYGVVAPNVFNVDTVLAVFELADELKSPVIIASSERNDLELIAEATRFYERRFPNVVAALHLDHGRSFEAAVKAIRFGYTSVMVDRSQLPFEDNVRETKEIVKMAHAVGVSVEAELGYVGQGIRYEEDRDAALTKTEEAIEFVKQTSVDCLAIAVGTAHGRYVGTPRIDFERLADIRANVDVPLVLHGGSSSGDENLKKAVELGIAKVNISTDLVVEGAKRIKEYLEREEFPNFNDGSKEGIKGYKDMIKHYMKLFDSVNRA